VTTPDRGIDFLAQSPLPRLPVGQVTNLRLIEQKEFRDLYRNLAVRADNEFVTAMIAEHR